MPLSLMVHLYKTCCTIGELRRFRASVRRAIKPRQWKHGLPSPWVNVPKLADEFATAAEVASTHTHNAIARENARGVCQRKEPARII